MKINTANYGTDKLLKFYESKYNEKTLYIDKLINKYTVLSETSRINGFGKSHDYDIFIQELKNLKEEMEKTNEK